MDEAQVEKVVRLYARFTDEHDSWTDEEIGEWMVRNGVRVEASKP